MSKKRKIRYQKTSTGENYALTISREAAIIFSGCSFFENITDDGVYFTSGSEVIIKTPPHQKNYEEI